MRVSSHVNQQEHVKQQEAAKPCQIGKIDCFLHPKMLPFKKSVTFRQLPQLARILWGGGVFRKIRAFPYFGKNAEIYGRSLILLSSVRMVAEQVKYVISLKGKFGGK